MLFLLPPSETKQRGGKSFPINQVALTFGSLNQARELILDGLNKVCAKPTVAVKVLKLSPKQLGAIEINLNVLTAPTLPAFERYTGTLYDALNASTLSASARKRAKDSVLIQSALFGLIPATDLIPNYRFSATTKLPKVHLAETWGKAHFAVFERLSLRAPIIDLRSKQYVALAPIPSHIESYWVEVVSKESDGKLRALNHFNKKSKGEFVRAVLESKKEPRTIQDLQKIASTLGFDLLRSENGLTLVVEQKVPPKKSASKVNLL